MRRQLPHQSPQRPHQSLHRSQDVSRASRPGRAQTAGILGPLRCRIYGVANKSELLVELVGPSCDDSWKYLDDWTCKAGSTTAVIPTDNLTPSGEDVLFELSSWSVLGTIDISVSHSEAISTPISFEVACAAGYQQADGRCVPCDPGSYKPTIDDSACRLCDTNKSQWGYGATECYPCDENSQSLEGATLCHALPNFFRTGCDGSIGVAQNCSFDSCEDSGDPNPCMGNNTCLEGYTGEFCGDCANSASGARRRLSTERARLAGGDRATR